MVCPMLRLLKHILRVTILYAPVIYIDINKTNFVKLYVIYGYNNSTFI